MSALYLLDVLFGDYDLNAMNLLKKILVYFEHLIITVDEILKIKHDIFPRLSCIHYTTNIAVGSFFFSSTGLFKKIYQKMY